MKKQIRLKWHEKTRSLLINTGIKKTVIEKATGVPVRWQNRFINDEFDHPSVNYVNAIYDYLLRKGKKK